MNGLYSRNDPERSLNEVTCARSRKPVRNCFHLVSPSQQRSFMAKCFAKSKIGCCFKSTDQHYGMAGMQPRRRARAMKLLRSKTVLHPASAPQCRVALWQVIPMISLEDCIGLCGLDENEVAAISEHEHIPEIAAAALANYLLHQ